MHGNNAYCRKHGHDFKIVERCKWVDGDGIEFWLRECNICGYKEIRKVWFVEEEME